MRFAQRASLLVAFSLLASAAPGYAECAWVLWQQLFEPDARGKPNLDKPLPGQHEPLKAFNSLRSCESALAILNAAKPEASNLLVCLPDTVDPRGPKGK
jgi:hypothetical protein